MLVALGLEAGLECPAMPRTSGRVLLALHKSVCVCVIKFLYTPKIPQWVVVQQIKAQCCDPKIDVNHNVTSINVTNRSLRRGKSARKHTHTTIVSCGEQRMIYLNAPPVQNKSNK